MIISKLIFACLSAVFLLGLWLARRGLRGVAVDDHVYCGKCSFDLQGIAKGAPCPECGNPALGPRRVGRRVRRPGLIAAGAAMIVLAPILQSIVLHGRLSSSLGAMEPLWLLREEIAFGSWDAGTELEDRINKGKLKGRDLGSVIEESLEKRHSNGIEQRIWWAIVADAAHNSGQMNDSQRRRYLHECVDVHWTGTLFMFKPAVYDASFTFDATIESAEVDGVAATIPYTEANVKIRHRPNMPEGETWISVLPPEKSWGKTLVVRWRVRTRNTSTGEQWAPDWVHTERVDLTRSSMESATAVRRRVDEETGAKNGIK